MRTNLVTTYLILWYLTWRYCFSWVQNMLFRSFCISMYLLRKSFIESGRCGALIIQLYLKLQLKWKRNNYFNSNRLFNIHGYNVVIKAGQNGSISITCHFQEFLILNSDLFYLDVFWVFFLVFTDSHRYMLYTFYSFLYP